MNFDVIDKIIAFYKKNCKISIIKQFPIVKIENKIVSKEGMFEL